ncbi:NUDIX domain protein [Shuttleworthella sp. MSX8B]|uniref:NUDIX hydrolase n=1 Tax=Shuttleworthella sp. MSX8B TaxID=936574 RepID=UPI00044E7C9A|nr:CoA pyrophosphatase [Shuttleworthia sp. MSX8B]EUB17721.1 NUDIX domain protein [Shuttleworthia sp. MSX8B]
MKEWNQDRFLDCWSKERPKLLGFEQEREASVAVPLLVTEEGPGILFEVRSSDLQTQPGEICFPGGGIEGKESPAEAALRETKEELLISGDKIHLLTQIDGTLGPSGAPMWAFLVQLEDYQGTYSKDEVAEVFVLSLKELLAAEPVMHSITMKPIPDEGFTDMIGQEYHWQGRRQSMPFYLFDRHLIWGATGRILKNFLDRVRAM